MKNLTLAFALLFCFFSQPASAQETTGQTPYPALQSKGDGADFLPNDCWHWQHPLPQGNTPSKVFFIDSNTGWAAGSGGLIMKTSDGGTTWQTMISGSVNDLFAIYFISSQTGWVVGENGTILKTSNGGTTWQTQISSVSGQILAVYFVDNQTGWAAGDDGKILKTSNGGSTWQEQVSGTTFQLKDLHFVNNQTGWAAGSKGTILKTTNGGSTWQVQSSGTTNRLGKVHFTDNQNGWVVSDLNFPIASALILKTTDGGSTWQSQVFATIEYFTAVHFINNQTGWAAGKLMGGGRVVLKTTNGGASWSPYTSGTTGYYLDVYFTDSQTGWAIAENGAILKSTNGGSNWQSQTPGFSGTNTELLDVHFTDSQTGWAVGWAGIVLKTNNGGSNWQPQTSGTTQTLYSIQFTDNQNGWVAGSNGTILKTSNGGSSWQHLTSGSSNDLLSLYFTDNQNGWAVGDNGTLLKTTNGGSSWEQYTSGTIRNITSIQFTNNQTGWMMTSDANGNSILLKTTNGGLYWQPMTFGATSSIYTTYFVDNQTGWAVGWDGIILKTTNGGSNWQTQTSGVNTTLISVYFTDPQTGWATGYDGSILTTSNGGASWQTYAPVVGNELYSIFFTDPLNGWAVGYSASILKFGPPSKPATQNISYCQNSPASPLTATGNALLWYTTPTGGAGTAIAPTPNTTTVGTTTYYVSQTAIGTTGCNESERAALTVTISALPTVAITALTPACTGQSSGSVTVTAAGGAPPYTYAWSNGQTAATAASLAAGVYTVTVTGGGCSNTATATITTVPATVAGFTYTTNGQAVTCTNTSVNANTYAWDFGNGQTSTLPNPVVNYANPGAYNACLTATGACGSTSTCQVITIAAPPALSVSVNALQVGAGSSNAVFDITSNCSAWTVTGAPSWFTTSPSSGANNSAVTLYFTQNTGNVARTAVLTISGCGLTQTVTVTQNGMVVSPWHIDSTGENHTIILPANLMSDVLGAPLQTGDQVGVFFDDAGTLKCGGYGVWNSMATAFAAFGNDAPAPAHNGFATGEAFKIKIWRLATNEVLDATAQYAPVGGVVTHTNSFASDGVSLITAITAISSTPHTIILNSGWNMISSFRIPSTPDMLDVFEPIATSIDVIKDGAGTSTIPAFGVNNIGNWNLLKGYQVKANRQDTLMIAGVKAIPESTPVPLQTGWQIIGYLRDSPQNIATVFNAIQGQISLVKDNFGKTYLPQFGINTIGNMKPGQGYRVKALSNVNLLYQANFSVPADDRGEPAVVANPVHFVLDSNLNTGNNATVVLPGILAEGLVPPGDEVGIFTPGAVLCGAAVYQGNNLAITAWGDDATTADIVEGLQAGEPYHFKVWKTIEQQAYTAIITLQSGLNAYEPDAIEVVGSMTLVSALEELAAANVQSLEVFPNPASEMVNIRIGSERPGKMQWNILSPDGVQMLASEAMEYPAGQTVHPLRIPSALPSGAYLLRLQFEGDIIYRKIMLHP